MNAQTDSTTRSHAVRRVDEARSALSGNCAGLASLGFVALLALVPSGALAATAPSLGADRPYAIVSDTYTNSLNAGTETKIIGLSSVSPTICFDTGPSTPPLLTVGTITTPCTSSLNVGLDFNTALANLNAQALLPSCTNLGAGAVNLNAVNLGAGPGVFSPGCYTNGGAMGIVANGIVILNGPGVYIFKPNGGLTTGADSLVSLANGACASDVFWAPTATTLGANSGSSPTPTFVGNILDPAGITIGHFSNVTGRALAFGVTVTTDASTITVPTCRPFGPGGGSVTDVPTLSQWTMILLAALLALAGFAAMRRRAR